MVVRVIRFTCLVCNIRTFTTNNLPLPDLGNVLVSAHSYPCGPPTRIFCACRQQFESEREQVAPATCTNHRCTYGGAIITITEITRIVCDCGVLVGEGYSVTLVLSGPLVLGLGRQWYLLRNFDLLGFLWQILEICDLFLEFGDLFVVNGFQLVLLIF